MVFLLGFATLNKSACLIDTSAEEVTAALIVPEGNHDWIQVCTDGQNRRYANAVSNYREQPLWKSFDRLQISERPVLCRV